MQERAPQFKGLVGGRAPVIVPIVEHLLPIEGLQSLTRGNFDPELDTGEITLSVNFKCMSKRVPDISLVQDDYNSNLLRLRLDSPLDPSSSELDYNLSVDATRDFGMGEYARFLLLGGSDPRIARVDYKEPILVQTENCILEFNLSTEISTFCDASLLNKKP